MSKLLLVGLLRRIRRLAGESVPAEESDAALLGRFIQRREEPAFAELVRRHGPMVLSVARALVGDGADADDVFQATFLVLARKATSLSGTVSVAGWLCGVARRVALQARSNAARRARHESQFMSTRSERIDSTSTSADLRPVLHEELARLSDKYREPMVLCYLEGLTNEEAAQKLGWPVGTLKVRMARARDLLRGRLARRGVTLSVAVLATLCDQVAASAAVVPASLADATVKSAIPFALGVGVASESLRPAAAALAHGVTRSMMLQKTLNWLVVTVALALAGSAALLAGQAFSAPDAPPPAAEELKQADAEPADDPKTEEKPAKAATDFPRRLLAISPSKYLYFNVVASGEKNESTHTLVQQLAKSLHISPSQVFELSDAVRDDRVRLPVKDAVTHAIREFLKTSRPQDRVIVLFTGHALEIKGECYLVPLEGDDSDSETLVPLRWVYEQLSNCKARQKVLILDVCRHDPERGAERPDSGAMTKEMERVLSKPPEGIQVWTACSAGEYSYERGNSYFLRSLAANFADDPEAKPKDPIPVTTGSGKANVATIREVDRVLKRAQTPRRYGKEPKDRVDFDPNEKAADPVRFPERAGAFARPAPKLIQEIIDESNGLSPGERAADGGPALHPDTLPIFLAPVLREYEDEGADTPLRDAVRNTANQMKALQRDLPMRFPTRNVILLKGQVQPVQRRLALQKLDLDELLATLDNVGKERDKEKSKRWQARYDLTRGYLLRWQAFIYEYQQQLARIRTDDLPKLEEHTPGWCLAFFQEMQATGEDGKEARQHAAAAKDQFEKVLKEHRGTPYEILARRALRTSLGLRWQPLSGR